MKRLIKLIFILSLIVACFGAGLWYINRFVLPGRAKTLVLNLIKERTGHEITLGLIRYLPPSHFTIKDITLYKDETLQDPLVNIRSLTFNFRIWPLLKKKKLIARVSVQDLLYDGVRVNGVASLWLKRRTSPAARPFLKNIDGTVNFINFSFVKESSPIDIRSITGTAILEDSLMRVHKTYFNYANTIYNMEGLASNLDKEEPQASFSLNSDTLHTEGNLILKDNYLEIKKIEGTLLDTPFNIVGDIKISASPHLNLYCEANLDLADFKKLFPKSAYVADSLKPAGKCDAVFFFNGKANRPKKAEASVKLSSNNVFLHGLALDDLHLDLRMKEGIIETHRLSMNLYQGLTKGSFTLDLNRRDLPYAFSFALKDGNLAKFSADMNFGQENMNGLLSSKFFLRGSLASADSLHGSGWITITDGHIWEWPLLGGVVDLLRLPHMRSVVFKEAAGNFIIDQKRISTEDLTFYSDRANISARGYVDFDNNVDVLVQTNITQDLIEGSSDTAEIANLILSQAGNYMGKIRITGTLDDPKFKYDVAPIANILKKEMKDIKKIEGLLKDILR